MSKREILPAVVSLICLGVVSRLIPHPWNMTTITAVAIVSSIYFGWRYSMGIFLFTMFITDLAIGFYQWQMMCAVYGGFALAAVIGCLVRDRKNAAVIACASLASSILFFLITNWAVWQFGSMYEHSVSGLVQCYVMALPFFRNALAGDVAYSLTLFGVCELAAARFSASSHPRSVPIRGRLL